MDSFLGPWLIKAISDYFTAVRTAEIAAAASLLTAGISLGSAGFVASYGRKTQEKLQRLTAELENRKSERNALRDHQYQARRRLYQECEPVIFRLTEECEPAFSRIATLARLSRTGRLDSGSESWIRHSDNQASTLYRIAAPLAAFSILKDKLTLFDLKLDPRIHLQYHLGQLMVEIFHHDLNLAKAGKELPYKPDSRIPGNEVASPAVYTRQGISDENLDALVSALTIDVGPNRRLISYPQFNQLRISKQEPVYEVVLRLDYLFRDFSPATKPVLWRVLLAQAILCRALTTFPDRETEVSANSQILNFSKEDREFVYSVSPSTKEGDSHIDDVLAFLRDRLDRTQHLRRLKEGNG